MSCGGTPVPVNPERIGEPGRWIGARPPARSAGCIHTWQARNILGIRGGPVAKVCTGCGETHQPAWVPATAPRRALPADAPAIHRAWPYIVGEGEWADLLRDRGAA